MNLPRFTPTQKLSPGQYRKLVASSDLIRPLTPEEIEERKPKPVEPRLPRMADLLASGKYITRKEVAKRLNLCADSISRYARKGGLERMRCAGVRTDGVPCIKWVWSAASVERFAANRKKGGKAHG